MVAMADVAWLAGVSESTVSHVRNDTRVVGDATREALLSATLGVASPLVSNPYHGDLVRLVAAGADLVEDRPVRAVPGSVVAASTWRSAAWLCAREVERFWRRTASRALRHQRGLDVNVRAAGAHRKGVQIRGFVG
jgi:hypothetical protein